MNLKSAAEIQQLTEAADSPVPLERRRQIAAHITSTPADTRAALHRLLPNLKDNKSLTEDEYAFAVALFDDGEPTNIVQLPTPPPAAALIPEPKEEEEPAHSAA